MKREIDAETFEKNVEDEFSETKDFDMYRNERLKILQQLHA